MCWSARAVGHRLVPRREKVWELMKKICVGAALAAAVGLFGCGPVSPGGTGGSGGTGGGSGGTGGSGGVPNSGSLVGWASVAGDGVATTSGGLGGDTVTPTTAQQLMDYAASSATLTIRIQGTFSVPRLQVSSNKTLIGIGGDATILGGIRIRGGGTDSMVENVIIQNLHVNGATSDVDGDAVQVHYAHHVWIDHCEIWDAADGNLDIVHASNWVTVSWNKFRYSSSPPADDHRFSNLIGHSDDNASEDTGRLKVTLHHNWWADRVVERMPRGRFGDIHVFDNYYSSTGNNYVIRAGVYAQILVENNYFKGVDTPHEIDGTGAQIVARGNVYDATTGAQDTSGSAFTPGYGYAIDAASSIPALVQQGAGPH